MKQAILAYLTMWGALILLCLVAPRLAFAGAKGVVTGNWRPWNRRLLRIRNRATK